MARLSATENKGEDFRNLLRSFEVIFWGASLLLGLGVYFSSSYLASHWVNPEHLPVGEVSGAIALMGVALVLQCPIALYSSGLLGLQHQVRLNIIVVIMSILRAMGAIAVLRWISPSVQAFFTWQVVVSCLHVTATSCALWRALPSSDQKTVFSLKDLKKVSPFALRMGFFGLITLFLLHGDKIFISKLASLQEYGYYTVAASLAASLYFVITPLFTIFFPCYSQLVASERREELNKLYGTSCQMLAVLMLPLAFLLAVFSQEVLQLWTSDTVLARDCCPILSILVLGTACNGLMNLPFALQLAFGWTRLVIIQNIISVALLFPLIFYSFQWGGMVGVAWIWLIHNLGCVLICAPLIHRKLIGKGYMAWAMQSILIPCCACVLITLLLHRCFNREGSAVSQMVWMGGAYLISTVVTGLCMPFIHGYLIKAWQERRLLQRR
jgi:O-antigen/teichoic acid export membrane protein